MCTFQGLMRELELREKKVNDIQALGDRLVREGHPGKKTVEVSEWSFTSTISDESQHTVAQQWLF